MANTPTDGIGVAAYVTLSGTSGSSIIVNSSGGANKTQGSSTQKQAGQGIGPGTAASGVLPVAQYALTLSLSSAGGYHNSLAVTAAAKDVVNSDVATTAFVAKSYNNPAAGSPAWYNPSNFAGYDPSVVSATASGATITITALALGQGVVEVQLPVFLNTLSSPAVGGTYPANTPGHTGTATTEQKNPNEMIYVQVVVTVIP
jgi:hypothetical protein